MQNIANIIIYPDFFNRARGSSVFHIEASGHSLRVCSARCSTDAFRYICFGTHYSAHCYDEEGNAIIEIFLISLYQRSNNTFIAF